MSVTIDGTNGITTPVVTTPVISASNITGSVSFFAFTTPPTGWLKCNGQAVSRTTYATLFAAIGTYYGAGDGSTTFNVPDLRGEFIRGLDDGRGVDSGRSIGTGQLDQMQRLQGTFNASPYTVGRTGAFTYASNAGSVGTGSGDRGTYTFDSGNSPNARVSADTTGETRPRNVALLACIKT